LEVRRGGGFDEVRTPSLVRRELWQQSGHWDLYQDNMFVLDADEHVAGLKPMNCPEEILVYKTRSRSYRDLPMRFADYSTLFRKERTGALAGLFRVRQLTQRFDLEYRSGEGHFERPVMIHYAIYGTFERFAGIIVEHFAGAFPVWLAPVQVMVVPIADRHLEYAMKVRDALRAAEIRAEI